MEGFEKPRLKGLLDHFAVMEDTRESWRVAHPLPEILLLVVCATIASCDDFDDIAAWGETHLPFLRRFLSYHHGVPGARWLNILMNRIDPDLFSDCFMAWAASLRPGLPPQIAIDGKTSRRTHDIGAARRRCILSRHLRRMKSLFWDRKRPKKNQTRSRPFRFCLNVWPARALWPERW